MASTATGYSPARARRQPGPSQAPHRRTANQATAQKKKRPTGSQLHLHNSHATSAKLPERCKDELVINPIGMVMGKKWRKADGARCRRHPRHRQGAGVCPFCLQERLSHLSPSVVRGGKDSEEGEEASSCSEASTMYSSTEGSTGASSASGSATPWAAAFHQEMRCGAARLSLLMRHERVVVDADEVVGVVRRRRERARRTSLWAKLLHATRGGGKKDGCSLAHSKTLDAERSTGAKWILF